MQRHCRYGKKGFGCSYPHPPMCFKFVKSGYKGCPKGDSCKYAHPKICRSSLLSRKCDQVKCYFYHATGAVRPNLNQDLPINTVPKRPVSDPTPLMHIRLLPLSPPDFPATDTQKSLPSFTKPYNVASSKTPDITSVFFRSNEGPEVPNATNPKLSAEEHYESCMAPLTSPESKPISSTNVLYEACPSFLHVSLSFHEYSSPNQ